MRRFLPLLLLALLLPSVAGSQAVFQNRTQGYPPGLLPAGVTGQVETLTSGGAAGALVVFDGSSWNCSEAKSQKVVNVACPPYNALGNDSTDNATALDSPFLDGRGKTIIIPPGTYRSSTAKVMTTNYTRLVCLGKAVLKFTGATNGVVMDSSGQAFSAHMAITGCTIQTSSGAALSGLKLADAFYSNVRDVRVDTTGSGFWTTGVDLVNAQGNTFDGNNVIAGAVTNMALDNTSTANTAIGVYLVGVTGTQNGLTITGSGRIQWLGGVCQTTYTVACFNVNGNGGGNPIATIIGAHVEITSGGGVGYRFNDTGVNATLTILSPQGGTIDAAPSAGTQGLYVFGGYLHGNITLGSGLTRSVIQPGNMFGGSVVNSSAIPVTIGSTGTAFNTTTKALTASGRAVPACTTLKSSASFAAVASTTGTTEEVLDTYTVAAGTLASDGDVIKTTAFCFGLTTNSKSCSIRFNGLTGVLVNQVTTAVANASIRLTGEITRRSTGTAVQVSGVGYIGTGGTATVNFARTALGGLTLGSTAYTIVITGTSPTQAGDMGFYDVRHELCKAA